ncbi:right-handed parallel beta-helix repeat-containing protein [Litoribrevibacter euphylliae]|uniref:Right-handed parallel beta-helix repeat-containing protein n=1 Tax=Litoribrevibacter euphylliae TaxID=1834034 RepID=A0ABV7HD39_9GAMM
MSFIQISQPAHNPRKSVTVFSSVDDMKKAPLKIDQVVKTGSGNEYLISSDSVGARHQLDNGLYAHWVLNDDLEALKLPFTVDILDNTTDPDLVRTRHYDNNKVKGSGAEFRRVAIAGEPSTYDETSGIYFNSNGVGYEYNEEDINAVHFGVVPNNNGIDDTQAIKRVLSYVKAGDEVSFKGDFVFSEQLDLPSIKITGPAKFKATEDLALVSLSSDSELEGIDFDFTDTTDAQLLGENVKNITLEKVRCYGSEDNGFYFRSCSDVTLKKCDAFDNEGIGFNFSTQTGLKTENITLEDCEAWSNLNGGIEVGGQGANTSTGVVQNLANNITLKGCRTFGNGNPIGRSGIGIPNAKKVTLDTCFSFDNREHGFSFQECNDVTITNCHGYENDHGGIAFQSGYDPHNPCKDINVSTSIFRDNKAGAYFKEINEDIFLLNCQFLNNTDYSVRFQDIGSSGLKSDRIVFSACKFTSNPVNSNGSTRVSYDPVTNMLSNLPLRTNQLTNQDIAEELTINTNGDLLTMPEMFYITTASGTDISRTALSQAAKGRRIYIQNSTGQDVRIRHNNGGAGFASFYNKSLSAITLADKEISEYIADGEAWIQKV